VRFLLEPEDGATVAALVAAGEAARRAGLDGVLLADGAGPGSALVAAAVLAGAVPDVLIAAEIALGDRHPLEVAEEAAVVDVASGGRLVLVARPAPGAEQDYPEALDLLRTAWTPRPFRSDGPRWPVPARLPGNVNQVEQRVRVTPAPARPRLELWGAGAGMAVAAHRALGAVADHDADPGALAALWRDAGAAAGPAALGAPRARRERWIDAPALRVRLLAGRRAFGQDWAVVRAPAAAADAISREVRPHLQLERLPDGLADHWAGDGSPSC
jgi:alkanesulfonate monooxygenase SsuD/methylene tetrahydromethanopterin reductase-like flavin-dependent oxidoreductase (luciferase family)